jgi:hypothetical protein
MGLSEPSASLFRPNAWRESNGTKKGAPQSALSHHSELPRVRRPLPEAVRLLLHDACQQKECSKLRTFLGLFVAQHLAGFQIDQMHAGASHALERLVRLIVVGHLNGGPSLHVLAGVWTTIEKRPRHRSKIAQTKREKPQPDGRPGLSYTLHRK